LGSLNELKHGSWGCVEDSTGFCSLMQGYVQSSAWFTLSAIIHCTADEIPVSAGEGF